MKYLTFVLALCIYSLSNGQVSSIDLYSSNTSTDQRNYGNGVINLLIQGDNLIRQGQWEEAIVAYDTAVEQWPNWAPVYLKRAMAKLRMGRTTEAERDLYQAYLISPNSVALFRLNNPAEKMQLIASLDDDQSPAPATQSINELKTNGQLAQVSALIDQLEQEGALPTVDIALLRGNLQLLLEEHNRAIAYYDWALQQVTSPELFHNRGLAKILTYNFPDGCADLERASSMGYAPSKEQHQDLCSF